MLSRDQQIAAVEVALELASRTVTRIRSDPLLAPSVVDDILDGLRRIFYLFDDVPSELTRRLGARIELIEDFLNPPPEDGGL
jgi:hypothetical protein